VYIYKAAGFFHNLSRPYGKLSLAVIQNDLLLQDQLKMAKNYMEDKKVLVYGAYGHTGKFVVAQLCEQSFMPILSGRDNEKLSIFSQQYPSLTTVVADTNQPTSLDIAFAQADIIINCAGPYLDTAEPVIQSALRLSKHYIDLSAEQRAVLDVYEKFSVQAKQVGILIIPAVAFYGGLGDLLSTSLTEGWKEIDDIKIYIGLNNWHPTKGTRLTGERNHFQRFELTNGQLQPPEAGNSLTWNFPKPIDTQEMIAVPLTEIITISKHLPVKNIKTYISKNSIDDIRSEDTPEPKPVDKKNRSSQYFCMQVVATANKISKTIIAQGQDIYAVTAPLVVEAVKRILNGNFKTNGVTTLGETFDASSFFKSLSFDDINISQIKEL
jgi:Saccharopine dehydrogenase NADP binding domain